MSETKHTPGPWHYEPDGMGDITIASSRHPLAIAAIVNGEFMALAGHADEHKANACLIAAAPDMFAALQAQEAADEAIRLNYTEWQALEDKALRVAALAKAVKP